jgi:hypothetical protein
MLLIMQCVGAEMQMRNESSATRLFSIGHSHHELTDLIRLLQAAGITAVADVRSSPFSQRHPQFNRPGFEAELIGRGISYVYFGDLLGGRPQQPSLYGPDGRVDYERVRAMPFFQKGLKRLIEGLDKFTIAMLCAEEDPLDCHRGLMITPALTQHDIAPLHLRGDGRTETTTEMETRLLAETRVAGGILDGLFAAMISNEEHGQLVADAYRAMARRKAFRRRLDDLTEPLEESASGSEYTEG